MLSASSGSLRRRYRWAFSSAAGMASRDSGLSSYIGCLLRPTSAIYFRKTRKSLVGACVKAIRGAHPYELPEIIALPIVGGLKGYLAWIGAETGGSFRPRAGARGV